MNRKSFVIDTNVLLHDPKALLQFKGNDVVIPLAVLEELDNLKKHTTDLGAHAREVMRFIDKLKSKEGCLIDQGIIIDEEKDIKMRIVLDQNMSKSGQFPLGLQKRNDQILLTAFELSKKGERVVLISKDLVTRVKAEAIGLETQDYENLKFSYEHLYRGIRKMEIDKPSIDFFMKEGYLELSSIKDFSPHEYLVMSCIEKSTAVGKYNHKTNRIESLLKIGKNIWGINPLNIEQKCALDLLLRDDVKLVSLIGQAGTGKTMMAIASGLYKVFDQGSYSKILVSRPVMPLGKDIGYLPGSKEDKLFHWMRPIYDNLEYLCQNGEQQHGDETLQWIMDSKKIEMEAVTYIRGRSLPKMFIIIDEAQNLTPHEVKTIISRAGKGTKIVLTGDPSQIDNPYLDKDSNALTYVVGKFRDYPLFGHIFLEKTERSELAALAADIL
ncbi:MAG: PhoH family protein [Rhabdochlamydiaceae bacterium]